ncbi:MAG TPA: hypothetical protein VFF06_14745 [Polyangia bacterium]|nr:hypothetical protein [Polyangia bacterium]
MRRCRLLVALALSACGGARNQAALQPRVSSTIALTSDDKQLWVVNVDADSVSLIDPNARTLTAEIPLAAQPPAPDPTTMRYEPSVKPRALAILPSNKKIYVAGQTANRVFVIDAQTRAVTGSIPVGAEPTAVVASPDGRRVYAVSHEAATVTAIDPATDQVVATLPVGEHPWGASVSADGATLWVSQFLLSPGVTAIDTATFTVRHVVTLADQPRDPSLDKTIPSGQPRGVYAAVPRPSGGEVWLPHLLLATKTAEPALDFQSTVFPTISTVTADGKAEGPRLLFQPPGGSDGSFIDVVSGPRAIAFTPDGKLALVADAQSEDVLVLDGAGGFEVGLVRPLPSTFPEGVAVDSTGRRAFVDGRSSHDVTFLAIDETNAAAPVGVDGAPLDRLTRDPMPPQLRLGQHLFYSANSAAFPITQNFWVACSSCHLEGGTDAVTWLFFVGPRDTPSNAGGPINTGFLLRQALRASVVDYDTTINIEQGGDFHRLDAMERPLLDAIAAFVNYAIPFPQNPNRAADGTLTSAQAHGEQLFLARCTGCHTGRYLTDSGSGNPTLDLDAGPIVLHDIGTCVTSGPTPDQPAPDEEFGHMHGACSFDTPTLRSVFATPPYFHDGSAATLDDVVKRLPASNPDVGPITDGFSDQDKADLVAFLKTL